MAETVGKSDDLAAIVNIIQTPIVSASNDDLWVREQQFNVENSTAEVLIISVPIANGSIESTQLQKIMQACKLEPNSYNILYLPENSRVAWHQVKEAYKPKYVLTFGIMPFQLGISAIFRLHTANNFDGSTWIPALSLTDMENQPEAKKELWINGLKPVFVDKP